MEIFSARLKWLRERRNLNQQDMADKLGLSQSYYGRFERNKGQPNLETLAKLPGILGEGIDFMLGLKVYDSDGDYLYQTYNSTKLKYERLKELINNPDKQHNDDDVAEFKFTTLLLEEAKKKYHEHVSTIPYAVAVDPVVTESEDGTLKLVPIPKKIIYAKINELKEDRP